jgi:hypothetical protein
LGDLVKGLIEPIAKRWSATMGGPLLMFWLAGALIVLWPKGSGAPPCHASMFSADKLCTIAGQGVVGPIALSSTVTALVVISAWALSASATFVLEILAGNWGTSRLALAHTRRRTARHRSSRTALASVGPTPPGLSGDRLDAWQVQSGWRAARRRAASARYPRPRDPEPLLPTALGNALISLPAEIRRRYGLELVVCWDLFIKTLETPARDELAAAATRVLARVQGVVCAAAACVWGLLLPGFWPRLIWVAGCSMLVWGAHRALRAGVDAYSRHVSDLFALHRIRLYRALGFAPPATTADEVQCGDTLSAFLSRALPPGTAPMPYNWPAT